MNKKTNSFFEASKNILKITIRKKLLKKTTFPNLIGVKKSIQEGINMESIFAKICWKESLKFHQTASRWKIVNNIPMITEGIKTSKSIIKQKNYLKNKILRKL
jgi:hypothetical protein